MSKDGGLPKLNRDNSSRVINNINIGATHAYRNALCEGDDAALNGARVGVYMTSFIGDQRQEENKTKLETRYNNVISQVNTEALYKGCPEKEVFTARNAFLDYLDKRYKEVQFPYTTEKTSAKMEEILGKEGIALYEAALQEEGNSKSYRDAVLMASTKEYDGPKWDKQLLIWIGGPSASGKTYGTDLVIDTVVKNNIGEMNSLLPSINVNEDKNYVVTIDGANERSVSLMRKLVLQIVAKQNYSDIDDLEDYSAVKPKAKSAIKNAIRTKEDSTLSMAIPETFVALKVIENVPLIKLTDHEAVMEQYAKKENCVQIFAKTMPDKGEEKAFEVATTYNGHRRKEYTGKSTDVQLDPFQPTPCESKSPETNHNRGMSGTTIGEGHYVKEMTKHHKAPILLDVYNDQLCLKEDPKSPSDFKECTTDDARNKRVQLMVNRYDYNNAQKIGFVKNDVIKVMTMQEKCRYFDAMHASEPDKIQLPNAEKTQFVNLLFTGDRTPLMGNQKIMYLNALDKSPAQIVDRRNNHVYNAKDPQKFHASQGKRTVDKGKSFVLSAFELQKLTARQARDNEKNEALTMSRDSQKSSNSTSSQEEPTNNSSAPTKYKQ